MLICGRNNTMTRRSMIGSAAAASLAPAAGARRLDMKVGLYSITYLGVWYRGDALSHEQLIERAKRYGYDGIEIDGKRPHGNPLDMPKKRCEEIRKRARGEGVPVYAVAANNDFSSPIPEHREAQLVYMRELIKMTSDLGAKTLRVFFAWTGVTLEPLPKGGGRYDIARPLWKTTHEKFSAEQTWNWCRQGLEESVRWARDNGVTLALQNHPPACDDYPDVLRMVKEIDSPNLKVCLDVGMMKEKNDEAAVLKAARAVRSLQVLSHFGGEYDEQPDGTVKGEAFFKPFLRGMAEIDYAGYIGYELCHPLPVVDGKTVGLDFADKNARLAVKFMRGLLAEFRGQAT
jgi:sugar phosphate isomerase/epimerase